MMRPLKDRYRIGVLDYLAGVHYGAAIADFGYQRKVMGYHYHRQTQCFLQIIQELQYLRLDDDVQASSGLIGYDNAWVKSQRHSYHGALFHSATKFMRIIRSSRRVYSNEREQLSNSLRRLGLLNILMG